MSAGWAAVFVTIGVAIFGLLLRITGQLSSLKTEFTTTKAGCAESKADRLRMWAKIDDHETRITRLEPGPTRNHRPQEA